MAGERERNEEEKEVKKKLLLNTIKIS